MGQKHGGYGNRHGQGQHRRIGAVSPEWSRLRVASELEAPLQGNGSAVVYKLSAPSFLIFCLQVSDQVSHQPRKIQHMGKDQEGLALNISEQQSTAAENSYGLYLE